MDIFKDSDCCKLDFKPISESEIPLLFKYFSAFPSRSCDFSIGGVLMWADYYGYEFAEYKDSLFIRGLDPETGKTIYYLPAGNMIESEYTRIISKQENDNYNAILLIPFETASGENNVKDIVTYQSLKEYLYPAERFLHFSGKSMEKKRNHLNYFLNNHTDAKIEPITPGNLEEIIEFTRQFAACHNNSELFLYENLQTIKVLNNYNLYPFEGIAIRCEGKIIGYTFGEKAGDTFFVHVEKGNVSYRGIYQALASFFCREITKKYPEVKYLNRDEDMGDENLRKSKESYHPTLYINKRIENIEALNENSLLRIA